MLRNTLAIIIFGTLVLFTACGKNPSYVPAFSTTAPTTAVEGQVYTYTFDVGAPLYAAMLSQLTSAPDGATLNGNTITWTPTAQQACVPNNFALTVSAPGGASARQSWVVTPVCVPVFTSTPPQAAEENIEYTYDLTATVPHGGQVTFQLTTAPAGATLSGSVLTWYPTPPPGQSRVANNFTVTAIAGGGGKASQSWTVSPSGTISGSCIDKYWTGQTNTPTPVPIDLSLYNVSAGVTQTDGSVQTILGKANADGTFSIDNVPAGYYALEIQPPGGYTTNYVTNSSTFDCGSDYAGPQPSPTMSASLTLDLTGGLTAWATGDGLALVSADGGVYCDLVSPTAVVNDKNSSCPVASADVPATTVTSFAPPDPITFTGFPVAPSSSDPSLVLQYVAVTGGVVLGPALPQPTLALTSGSSATITGALTPPSSPSSIDVTVAGPTWSDAYAVQGPGSAKPEDFFVDLSVQPIVGGQADDPGAVVAPGATENMTTQDIPRRAALGLVSLDVAQVTTSVDLGSQKYNNPFPTGWPIVFSARGGSCDSASHNVCAEIGYSTTTLPTVAIAPPMSPVLSPTLNGTNLLIASSTTSPNVTLSWSAPTGSTPYGYAVYAYQAVSPYDLKIATYTTQTSADFTMGSKDGTTYFFVIEALADGGQASILTGPYHWKYPTAYAAVMSGPVTIGGL